MKSKKKLPADWQEVVIYALFLIVLLLLAFSLIMLTASTPKRILITSQHSGVICEGRADFIRTFTFKL